MVEIVNVSLIASIKPAQAYLTIVINWKCDYTQIEGTIVAPDDPKNWNFAKNGRIWLGFFNLTGALFKEEELLMDQAANGGQLHARRTRLM